MTRAISDRIRPNRKITGMSAILVPLTDQGSVDWQALENHVGRTSQAGLTPAVNMDTGYVNLLDQATRMQVLDLAQRVTGGDFVAGAYVADEAGADFDLGAYEEAATEIASRGGTPIVFPSHGLNDHGDHGWLASLALLAQNVDRFIGFELGSMFLPHGRIVSLDTYKGLLEIPQCIGAKHSSLSRQLEWDRLELRDQVRPDFMVMTGNDLAIDMVMYGSDYLLGLSTFAPDLFDQRDRMWETGDAGFHELNDMLQYLGHFAFRAPVPAYRHNAATFLHLRGWAASDLTPEGVPRRPDADREVLADIADRLGVLG